MLFKYSGKYVDIHFNMKITYPFPLDLQGFIYIRFIDLLITSKLIIFIVNS